LSFRDLTRNTPATFTANEKEFHVHSTSSSPGGAGFIGSHLADELLSHGYRVRVAGQPCAAGARRRQRKRPDYLESRRGAGQRRRVRSAGGAQRAASGIDAVYHLASAVGVGQSMYEVAHYTRVNNLGTAVLMEALIERPGEAAGRGLQHEPLRRRLVPHRPTANCAR
jgi:dTDP-D-glucose 4,6-dehydratase